MSVQSEIDRIKANVSAAYQAVKTKGGTIPITANSENLRAAVESIPTGEGAGGNPIGTVISFLGMTPPVGYLVCDGTIWNIEDYPDLASFFGAQFGSAHYFGGDGTETFALPDMRNLFLRGYHGTAQAISGEIGKRQDGTQFPWREVTRDSANFPNYNSTKQPTNFDTRNAQRSAGAWYTNQYDNGYYIQYSDFTARPVNMAVLYCIKAIG